jgi:hypothetical protein
MPSRIASQVVCGSVRSCEAGSGVWIAPRKAAEIRNEMASTRTAIGAVSAWTSRPLSPNEATSIAAPLASSLLFPRDCVGGGGAQRVA